MNQICGICDEVIRRDRAIAILRDAVGGAAAARLLAGVLSPPAAPETAEQGDIPRTAIASFIERAYAVWEKWEEDGAEDVHQVLNILAEALTNLEQLMREMADAALAVPPKGKKR